MSGFNRMLGACVALVLTGALAPVALAKPPPTPAAQSRAVVPLSLMHHVAQREIALGLLAQVAAVRPETMRFATDLETDFRQLDRRILAIAEALGIGENRLKQAYADQNTAALDGQADDLERLSMLRGQAFDRAFWVTLAGATALAVGFVGIYRAGRPKKPRSLGAQAARAVPYDPHPEDR